MGAMEDRRWPALDNEILRFLQGLSEFDRKREAWFTLEVTHIVQSMRDRVQGNNLFDLAS
jgi:hypothetical protein